MSTKPITQEIIDRFSKIFPGDRVYYVVHTALAGGLRQASVVSIDRKSYCLIARDLESGERLTLDIFMTESERQATIPVVHIVDKEVKEVEYHCEDCNHFFLGPNDVAPDCPLCNGQNTFETENKLTVP